MDYRLENRNGVEFVVFRCPACGANLSAKVEKAGSSRPCPKCRNAVTVPGVEEKKKRFEEQLSKELELEERAQWVDTEAVEAIVLEPVPALDPLPPRRPLSVNAQRALITLLVTALCCLVLIAPAAIQSARSKGSVPQREAAPIYRDALQALVDDVDDRLNSNLFGEVTCKGNHAIVVLDESYFLRTTTDAKVALLTNVRDIWFKQCHGGRITFKTWSGTIIADF